MKVLDEFHPTSLLRGSHHQPSRHFQGQSGQAPQFVIAGSRVAGQKDDDAVRSSETEGHGESPRLVLVQELTG